MGRQGAWPATLQAVIPLNTLPTLNAVLNSVSAILLALGYYFIRRRDITAHKRCMLGAFATSSLFLISYLTYHYHAGSKPFPREGAIRSVYFTILISHTVLAAVILPMAITTLRRALTGNFVRHVRIARLTLPLWFYVSVTGVVVYWMLYRL